MKALLEDINQIGVLGRGSKSVVNTVAKSSLGRKGLFHLTTLRSYTNTEEVRAGTCR